MTMCALPSCEKEVFDTKHCSDLCKRLHRCVTVKEIKDPAICLYCSKALPSQHMRYCSDGLHRKLYLANQKVLEDIRLGIGKEGKSPFVKHVRKFRTMGINQIT